LNSVFDLCMFMGWLLFLKCKEVVCMIF